MDSLVECSGEDGSVTQTVVAVGVELSASVFASSSCWHLALDVYPRWGLYETEYGLKNADCGQPCAVVFRRHKWAGSYFPAHYHWCYLALAFH